MADDVLAGKYGRRVAEPSGAVAYIEALGLVGASHYAIRVLNADGHLATDSIALITIQELATYALYKGMSQTRTDPRSQVVSHTRSACRSALGAGP